MDRLNSFVSKLTPAQRRDLLAVLLDAIAGDYHPHHTDKDPEIVGANYVSAMNDILGINILQQDRHRDYLWGRNCVIWQLALDGFTEAQISKVILLNRSTICNSKKQMRYAIQLPEAYPFATALWNKFTQAI